MEPRLNWKRTSPQIFQTLSRLEALISDGGLDANLLDLVKLRASQINGCAFCIDMHSKDLRAHGESEQRLYALNAWRETPFFSDRERAALAWTEAVTLIAKGHAPDDVFEETLASKGEITPP